MDDLISRQAAIDAVLHHGEIENDYTDLYHDGYCDGVYDSADILKALPSAEPKTGRWMFPDPPIHKPICSECGKPCIGLHAFECQLTDYCPNCGARMKGEADG